MVEYEEKAEQRGAVFLDRDGTINVDTGYIRRKEDFVLLEGAGEAVRLLNEAGYPVIVLSNQSGIARGFYSEETLEEIHAEMKRLLAGCGAKIDAVYYCPHHPEIGNSKYTKHCNCRKPAPGLYSRAVAEFSLDPRKCFAVGDSPRDIIPAEELGCRTVLLTGKPLEAFSGELSFSPSALCPTLLDAVRWILSQP